MLSYLQTKNNNVKQLSINFAFNELAYNFKINDSLDMLVDLFLQNYQRLRQIKKKNVEIIMIFANIINKVRYDQNHRTIINVIQPRFMIYLKLH